MLLFGSGPRRLPLLLGFIAAVGVAQPLQAQRRLGYFLELGGPGGLASLNLDLRVGSHIHARAGAGSLLWPTLPVTASYVTGDGRTGLELGAGGAIFFFPEATPDASWVQRFVELITIGKGVGTVAVATGIVGYRHEGKGGFVYRLTFTPYYGRGKFLTWFGLSLGSAF